ncbi:nitroreductase [Aliibacillus thermotolerans]|uniref:Putative NAD(P)H nitroreductase n=1 Tax=Aliibacillus thermotolerans TaxID=1834418 RepID=A0ABW0U3U1_9BACI|nr:nitroreductase [Aliibacillus thermotolerans]
MELKQGLLSRRTINAFKKDPVEQSLIEDAIQAAIHAPNHKMTEPWHFYIFTEETKKKVAARRADLKAEKFVDQGSERAKEAWEKNYQFLVDLPWVIAVTTKRNEENLIRAKEDYAATAAAIQNFMLSLWAHGVGVKWATGRMTQDEEMHHIIGAKEDEELIGILFIGYPEIVPKAKERQEKEVVTWV